jgi:hypothetical protein
MYVEVPIGQRPVTPPAEKLCAAPASLLHTWRLLVTNGHPSPLVKPRFRRRNQPILRQSSRAARCADPRRFTRRVGRIPDSVPIHYSDPNADVPPGVDFLDDKHIRAWVAACELNKPWRVPMRLRFAELVATLSPRSRVLELGSGPGLLGVHSRPLYQSCEL